MSATPNNAAPGWDQARPLPPTRARDAHEADGHNALQGLLAFACIHQQAARRKRETQDSSNPALRFSREEELALDEILQLVAVRAIAITGADGVAIALAKDRAIVCRASAGKIAPDPGVKLDPNSGFSGACLRGGEIIRCDDSENDPRVNAQTCRALGTRSMIAVPLTAKKRVIGLLEAFSVEACGFNESDVRSLNLLGELILAAIRPEEEHHLAEMAREILPEAPNKPQAPANEPVPAVTSPVPTSSLVPAAAAPAPAAERAVSVVPAAVPARFTPPQVTPTSKVLVDEKFAPGPTSAQVSAPDKVREKNLQVESRHTSSPDGLSDKTSPATMQAPRAPLLEVSHSIPATEEVLHLPQELSPPHREVTPSHKGSLVNLTLTAAAIMLAVGLTGVWMWKSQHLAQPISADTQTRSEIRTDDEHKQGSEATSPAPPLQIGALANVTAIHHSSTMNASTVVVELQDQVQYEAHSLDNPPRIYFDLHDTKLSSNISGQISVDDAFLKRVRVAQPLQGITRVVLETKNEPDFSVSLDNNPYRLTIELHKPGARPASSAPDVKPQPAPPKPSPSINAPRTQTRASSDIQGRAEGFEVVLDAGHGGWDLGTVGKKGLLEKDLVFDIVQRLGNLLESRMGASVIYTRANDSYMALEKRAEIANLSHADVFVSVHANYSDLSTARGVETYYTNTYSSVKARTPEAALVQDVNWSGVVDIRAKVKGAKLLASDIQQTLYGGLAARNPDLRNRGVKEAQYVVLTGTQMPAVLAEVSFVSSPADEDRLQSSEYRQQIAEALYKGIAKYRDDAQGARLASARKIQQ